MKLNLRCICNCVSRIRQHGSPSEKAAIVNFELSPSLTEFVSKVLHQKPSGNLWNNSECFYQKCQSTDALPCGPQKLQQLFDPLLKQFGSIELLLIQHERVQYIKVDGSVGQPYVRHKLKMLLASKMRQEIHENLSVHDVVAYSDYSKELEIIRDAFKIINV